MIRIDERLRTLLAYARYSPNVRAGLVSGIFEKSSREDPVYLGDGSWI